MLVQTVSELNAVIGLGVSTDRVTLQGLGVEPSECTGGDRVTARGAWGIRDEEYVVGHLANQSEEKGTVDLLVAAELARRKGAKVRVVLAGPMTATFRRFWNHFGSAKWVSQLGPLTDAQRRDFYAGIDAFCMPSRTDSFGLVFLEAWANGVPVIGYRAGGVADLIRDRTDGRLVRCSDIDGLAESLREMGDRAQREEWGRRGRARTAIEFRWEDKIAIARRVLRAMPSTD